MALSIALLVLGAALIIALFFAVSRVAYSYEQATLSETGVYVLLVNSGGVHSIF